MEEEARRRETPGPSKHQDPFQSSAILKIIEEIHQNACRYPPPPKQKHGVKDFMKENVATIRQMQLRNKEEKSKQFLPLRPPNRFSHVKSKVYEANHVNSEKGSPEQDVKRKQRCYSCSPHYRKKYPHKPVSTPHPLGYVPPYVAEEKKKCDERKRLEEEELKKASIPPGHILLSEDQRLQTLDLLKQNQEELIHAFQRLPIRCDTLKLCRYKEDLEKKLAKVEEGLKIFSRPKVFVRTDS